jgi:hypothetical protein
MYSTLEKEITNLNLLYYWNFLIPSGNTLFPIYVADSWLAASSNAYVSTEYHNSRQNIKIPFWNYLFDINNEDWLNLFWKYAKGKLFAVDETHLWTFTSQINDAEQLILTIENKPLLLLFYMIDRLTGGYK